MHRLALLTASLCFAASAACADTPPPAPTSASTPAASAASVVNSAPAASSTADARTRPASAGGLTDAEVKRAFAKFRKQQRDGKTVYCRREAPLGTRLGSTVCYSEDQVLANARAERDAGMMQSQQNVCGAGGCNPGSGG